MIDRVCHARGMNEYSVISQGFSMLLLQIPLVLGILLGMILLLKNQHLLGAAGPSAFIGIFALLALSLIGPFYQAWVTKMTIRSVSSDGVSPFMIGGLLINCLWAISIVILVISIFVGRSTTSEPTVSDN